MLNALSKGAYIDVSARLKGQLPQDSTFNVHSSLSQFIQESVERSQWDTETLVYQRIAYAANKTETRLYQHPRHHILAIHVDGSPKCPDWREQGISYYFLKIQQIEKSIYISFP